jgi:predicted transport protein
VVFNAGIVWEKKQRSRDTRVTPQGYKIQSMRKKEQYFFKKIMQVYNLKNWKLEYIKESWFKLEKDMQNLVEKNIEEIFWLEFICTEFQLNSLRIDTLAFDQENNSFVIIEYKRWSSYSVIDQWFSYLSLALNNKADFVQELGKNKKKFIDKSEIDWSQTKIIFIADNFTRYQKESINFKDLPIELYELKNFNNWSIILNPIKTSENAESIKTVTKLEPELDEINKELKVYDLDSLFWKDWEISKEMYEELKDFVLNLDWNLKQKINKHYIWFKIWFQNLIWITPRKWWLDITFPSLNKKDFQDFKNLVIDNNKKSYLNEKYIITSCTFQLKDKNDMPYLKDLILQAFKHYN